MAELSRFVNAVEYSRRNTAHANAVGAHANTKAALARLLKMKRPPMWLVAALEGIERRTAIVHPEVAAWRNSAPDNPYGVSASESKAPSQPASPSAAASGQAAVQEVQPSAQTDDALEVLRELVEMCERKLRRLASGVISGKPVSLCGWHEDDLAQVLDRARKLVNGGAA